MIPSFYTLKELAELGLKSYGTDVKISRFARLYNVQNISIGNHVRIDDFCIISANCSVEIGNYVHVACYCSILGNAPVIISDFCGLSGRVSLYSSTDDYLGSAMTNPTVPEIFTNVFSAPVVLEKHVIVGAGSIILPGAILHEGVAIGALSLVNQECESNFLYTGNPLKKRIERHLGYKEMEKKLSHT